MVISGDIPDGWFCLLRRRRKGSGFSWFGMSLDSFLEKARLVSADFDSVVTDD